jgi:ATP adenylyltransferase
VKNLWAPWRMEYIAKDKSDECIFCTRPKSDQDEKNKILFRGPLCFVIMNIFPYNNGHVMVSPHRHISCLTLLSENEIIEISKVTQKSIEVLREVYNPDGFNIGFNIGKAAGAGFDEHLHNHIVPRWAGDTNFMPMLAETKVHPEHLETSYKRLSSAFKNISI